MRVRNSILTFLPRSNTIELAIPGHEVGHAFLHGSGGLVADGSLQFVDVGVGVRYVPGLQGQQLLDGLLAHCSFDGLDIGRELHRVVVADVEQPPGGVAGGGVRLVTVPVGVGLGNLVADADHTFGDVGDVSEIPRVVAVVEHLDGFAFEDVPGEQEQRHVRPTPGAVHGEEAQAGGGQAVQVAVGMGHQLVGSLGGSVELQRVHGGLVLAEGHVGVGAVHAAGAGVGEVRRLVVAAGLDDVHKRIDVAAHVGPRVHQGIAHAGLGGQVDDAVEGVLGKAGVHGGLVGQVGADEGELGPGFGGQLLQLHQAGFLDGGVVVVVDHVKTHHLVTPLEQLGGNGVADEAGGAGDK